MFRALFRTASTRRNSVPALAAFGLLALVACSGHDRLADYRPVVDSYRTDMAAYDDEPSAMRDHRAAG